MLRVGLTGGLGSGKSTVAAMLRDHGAHILNSDDIARELMQPPATSRTPRHTVYPAIVAHFGPTVVRPDHTLDREALARFAFSPSGAGQVRLAELNAIIHPAVIAEQAERIHQIAAADPDAIIVVESALLFETPHAGPEGWKSRFDRIVLVTAPEALRIERFVDRALRTRAAATTPAIPPHPASPPSELDRREELTRDARRRIAQQLADKQKIPQSDFVLENTGSIADLREQVDHLWTALLAWQPAPHHGPTTKPSP